MASPEAGPSRRSMNDDEGPTPLNSISLTISHKGNSHHLQLAQDATLQSLREEIQAVTDVPITGQKLLPPRSRGIKNLDTAPAETLLSDCGFVPSSSDDKAHGPPLKIMLLGSSDAELTKMRKAEEEAARRNGPRNYHPSMLRGTKARNTAQPSQPDPFASIQAHPSTPPSSALHSKIIGYLTRLAKDPAILHICRLHHFSVGILTELLPHEHPNLLGLNENMGQRISLRIRTDDYEGLRDYKTSRRVLVHELAHNVVNDHPPEFKILNSKLNAEMEAYESGVASGTHTLFGKGDIYEPSGATETSSSEPLGGGAYVLGGGTGGGGERREGEGLEERRRRVLEATMKRWEKVDGEIEKGCGAG